ncbi:hypothetical protein IFM89_006292, partial [Coptis chinensis]
YASESIRLACKYAYRNATPGSTLTVGLLCYCFSIFLYLRSFVLADDYFLSRLPTVERRLAQGGVRLAATLNRIFTTQPSISVA